MGTSKVLVRSSVMRISKALVHAEGRSKSRTLELYDRCKGPRMDQDAVPDSGMDEEQIKDATLNEWMENGLRTPCWMHFWADTGPRHKPFCTSQKYILSPIQLIASSAPWKEKKTKTLTL
eukprot:scaffold158509_cov19-Tisochrysis_lutea.AAC.3